MKLLIILSLITTSLAYGGETKTECPWMREMNKRNNPKASLVSNNSKIKIESKSNISTRQ
jgi:hypothetical protein